MAVVAITDTQPRPRAIGQRGSDARALIDAHQGARGARLREDTAAARSAVS